MPRTLFFTLAGLILLLDQLTKFWIVNSLPIDTSQTLIPNFLYFARTTNSGAAFGVLPHATGFLAGLALIAAIGIGAFAWRSRWPLPILVGLGLALPLGGALGNFIDRVRLGYVVDFIELHFGSYVWPNFNLADSSICVGVAMLIFAGMQPTSPGPIKTEETHSIS
jgi:signal peptidase II